MYKIDEQNRPGPNIMALLATELFGCDHYSSLTCLQGKLQISAWALYKAKNA